MDTNRRTVLTTGAAAARPIGAVRQIAVLQIFVLLSGDFRSDASKKPSADAILQTVEILLANAST